MKRLASGMIALIMCITLIAGGAAAAETKTISVVTTIFPVYDWLREIVGETSGAEITMLLDTGVDLHSYQPTAQDIMKIANADAFVYVGGESDEWVEDALSEAVNPEMVVVDLMETLGADVKEEEIVEGMEAEEEEEGAEGEEEEGPEYDEHVWLSLRNAQKLVTALAEALGEADPAHADAYSTNASAYNAKLAALDDAYTQMTGEAARDTVLFGDRFPFRYLTDDYGLNYYAAFVGCSAESEASFETIACLAGKVDELGLNAVLTIEGANHRIAETVVAASQAKDAAVLTLDSLQSATAEDVRQGKTYLGAMEANLEVLREALNGGVD